MSYICGLVLFLTVIPLTIAESGAGCVIHSKHEIQELERPTNDGQISSQQPPTTYPKFSKKLMDQNYVGGRPSPKSGVVGSPGVPCRHPPPFTPPNPAGFLPPPT